MGTPFLYDVPDTLLLFCNYDSGQWVDSKFKGIMYSERIHSISKHLYDLFGTSGKSNPHCHLIFNRVDNNGKRISDSNWLKRNVRVCKELKQKYGLTFGEGKSQTRTEILRPNERIRYEMANDVRSALKDSHSWKDFSNNLKAYGINAQIKFRSGIHIPQGISFTRNGTTFKGSSLDRCLSFSKIDKALTDGMNIDTGGQAQDLSVHESRSNAQDYSLTTDLSMLAADLAIGLIGSGQNKKSEEQDLAPRKKRGMRL